MAEQSLEELFARLKAPPDSSNSSELRSQAAAFSPSGRGTPPTTSPETRIPSSSNAAPPLDQRLMNLVNLFKPEGTQPPSGFPSAPRAYSQPQSVTDVVGSLQRTYSNPPTASLSLMTPEHADKPASQSAAQKDYLLNLLSRPKESAASNILSPSAASSSVSKLGSGDDVLPKLFGESSPHATTQAPQSQSTIFNRVSPFDQLHSSLSARSPLPEPSTGSKKISILKPTRDIPSPSAREVNASTSLGVAGKLQQRSTIPSPMPAEKPRQSVSDALEGLGESVGKEADAALAQAFVADVVTSRVTKTVESAAEASNSSGDANAKGDTATANNDIDSSWESAEDDLQQDIYEVPVYNFPMKPFASIQLKNTDLPMPIRQDNFMMIAQLKKSFDQMDRSLITATQTHIAYAQIATKKDNRGLRIIRQDTGDHKQVFRSSDERIFNVQFCTSDNDVETILGTGAGGSVIWTSLAKSRGDLFKDDDIESQGFMMPPVATSEEQTSGSPVKTRAKMSSRHPDFFAVARGKSIYIISPELAKSSRYCNSTTRKIDSEKFLAEHSLKITTGKAGKDFCFSEDDTVIVTLDKSGRVKFWDIRELTKCATEHPDEPQLPVELTEPLWTFTASTSDSKPEEKPSVSSVTFIDKEKPTTKGTAMRYMIIGYKQNHILQLYDLALKRAVQEVRLPHEKDSDGFCSISYHPRSGIIAIGHPTRNSIYFIHLSAPRYNLGAMNQARFTNLIVGDDPSALPKPESTAIMSGVRELSFSNVGQLRSVDMLREPVDAQQSLDPEQETLFELYVMHSKGATEISIKRKDLGWNKSNGIIKPLDAIQTRFVEIRTMDIPAVVSQSASEQISSTATPVEEQAPVKIQDFVAAAAAPAHGPAPVQIKKDAQSASSTASNGTARATVHTTNKSSSISTRISRQNSSNAASTKVEPTGTAPARDDPSPVLPNPTKMSIEPEVPPGPISPPQSSALVDFQAVIGKQFDALYQRMDSDRRVQDAAGAAKQDAMLRLVSSTLAENVEKSLTRIVSSTMEKEFLPQLTISTTKSIEKKLTEIVPQQVSTVLPKEVKAALPSAIQNALKDTSVLRAITEQTATQVQQHISTLLQQSLPTLAAQAAQKVVSEFEVRTAHRMQELEVRHQQDSDRILELSNLLRSVSQTISVLSDNQMAFQQQMSKQLQLMNTEQTSTIIESGPVVQELPVEAEDSDIVKITKMLMDGQYDPATLEWLQSPRQDEIFDKIFVRVNPQYLNHVSPLIALSVAATITANFYTHIDKRLEWLATVLTNINLQDADIRDVAPKIMDVISQRLQEVYMRLSEANAADPALRRISALNRSVQEISRLSG